MTTACHTSHVQSVIENMIFTSYSDKSYFVASVQMISGGRSEHQVSQQFLSHDMTFLSRGGYIIP